VSGNCSCHVSTMLTISSIQPCHPERNENDAPSCEAPSPYSPGASSAVPDANDESPTKDTSSVRKGLIGSLRKQKLRSISSLRSLRSPTKTKQSDASASPLAEVGVPTNYGKVYTEPVFHRVLVPQNIDSTHRSFLTSSNHPLINRYSISNAKTPSPQA
jgi:hypothetical protein